MKNIAITIFLITLSPPSKALTWKEFWEPFIEATQQQSVIRNRIEPCYKVIKYEEYIPGNSYVQGYVRQHREEYQTTCH